MDLNDFNNATYDDSQGFGGYTKIHFTITAYEGMHDSKNDKDYINIELTTDDDEPVMVRQYLNKREDGKYKNHIYPGATLKDGTVILPSITWEILQLAKEKMGEKRYDALKKKLSDGKVNREFIEALDFDLDVKRVKNSEGDEFIIPMFAYNKKKDEDYRKEQSKEKNVEVNPDEVFAN